MYPRKTNLLFKKRGDLAHENLLAIIWAPDKVVGQLVGNVFGMLRIHIRQYNMCSTFSIFPLWGRLTPR
jgi:hypothetical protein